jgi:ABC-type polysaccharide/polyol phosphate export permease
MPLLYVNLLFLEISDQFLFNMIESVHDVMGLIQRYLLLGGGLLGELWRARELVLVLTERELRVRYKQTKIGFAWAILIPFLMMVVFSVFLGRAAQLDDGPFPYALTLYVALLPWMFVANSMSQGAVSIVQNMSLVNKVYCPREVFPLASLGAATIDLAVALPVLGLLFVAFGVVPAATSFWVVLLFPVQVLFTAAVTMLMAALVVYLRDLRQVLPMVVQFAMFATPVLYPLDRYLDERWWPLASVVNPLVPVIDGYRRVVLEGAPPQWGLLGLAAGSSLVAVSGAFYLFKRLETGFADVA